MKKAEYAAYSKMYFKGKLIGRAFRTATGDTATEAKRQAMQGNRHWNKQSKDGYNVKFVQVKKLGQKRTAPQRRGLFGGAFGGF